MISVIDYGVCNLGSTLNMLRKIGVEAQLVSSSAELEHAEKIILPGVGSFDYGMAALTERGLAEVLRNKAQHDKVPLLGICLGMQMLGMRSEEGTENGLGLIDAETRRFRFAAGGSLKVPHMGWSHLAPRRESALLRKLEARSRFYFCHSYHMVCNSETDVLAEADYGEGFVAIVQRCNVFGVQFHPEKSHRFGMDLLHNFAVM